MLKRFVLLLFLSSSLLQIGCAAVAAGAAGGVIGHELTKDSDDDGD